MRDVESFTDFVSATQATLRRTAYLVCGDWDLASDYVQEGLIRVYRHWGRLDRGPGAEAALRAYARKAVVNVAIDAGRRRSSKELVRAVLPEPTPGLMTGLMTGPTTGPEGPAADLSERDAMMRALATIPPGRRACVVLRFYEDLSVADVAATLGISEGTVKSQTAKGLAALRAALDSDDARGGSHV